MTVFFRMQFLHFVYVCVFVKIDKNTLEEEKKDPQRQRTLLCTGLNTTKMFKQFPP